MTPNRLLSLVGLTALLFGGLLAGTAQANTHAAFAYNDNRHAVWVPGLDQRHLIFDPGATLTVLDDAWHLTGDLTSLTDGSKWSISVDFGSVLTGAQFGALTGHDDGRIKGAKWSDMHADWAFAEQVTGLLMAHTGDHAGKSFSLERYAGRHDYYAQFGTCMNDKNCDKGLSTWLTFTDLKTGEKHRGDINIRVERPVPEPGAALVFGAGLLVMGAHTRQRRRS